MMTQQPTKAVVAAKVNAPASMFRTNDDNFLLYILFLYFYQFSFSHLESRASAAVD